MLYLIDLDTASSCFILSGSKRKVSPGVGLDEYWYLEVSTSMVEYAGFLSKDVDYNAVRLSLN